MKKLSILIAITFLCSLFAIKHADASINKDDLTQFSEELGISQTALENYLRFYEYSLDDFHSIEELSAFLGSPVNDKTLGQLLAKYELTEKQLNVLLTGFGESVKDYLFLKDLDTAVGFYVNHAEVLRDAEKMLAKIGMTEEEIDNLFQHMLTLDQSLLGEKMGTFNTRLEPFFSYNSAKKLTDQEKTELQTLYEEMIATFNLRPVYFVISNGTKQSISFNDLLKQDTLADKILIVELKDKKGEVVVDMQFEGGKLTANAMVEHGEQILNVAGIASEMNVSLQGQKAPNTASPYGLNMIVSSIMLLLGFFGLLLTRHKLG
ncbi:processed acidic surface protein [Bacillus timonensis]|nr:processed acidic surface protein [Bacillus timonensis]